MQGVNRLPEILKSRTCVVVDLHIQHGAWVALIPCNSDEDAVPSMLLPTLCVQVSAVLVGCDAVTLEGDVVNKVRKCGGSNH